MVGSCPKAAALVLTDGGSEVRREKVFGSMDVQRQDLGNTEWCDDEKKSD